MQKLSSFLKSIGIEICFSVKDNRLGNKYIPFKDGLVRSEKSCNTTSSSKSKEEKHSSKKLRMQIFGLSLLLLGKHQGTLDGNVMQPFTRHNCKFLSC